VAAEDLEAAVLHERGEHGDVERPRHERARMREERVGHATRDASVEANVVPIWVAFAVELPLDQPRPTP
jgi:hypothetical protein